MKHFLFAATILAIPLFFSQTANAQWVRTYRPVQPVFVAPQPVVVTPQPVFVAPQPVVVARQPMVVYQPTTVVYSRRRPILGGYAVRTRPGVQRTMVW